MKYCYSCFHLLILCLLLLINTPASSICTIDTLPGFPGTLPFKLQTGYIGVGEEDEVQLFYYFIQSENDPHRDPLILWLNGEPGCSGPLAFDVEAFDGSLPSFVINPYSWTKIANIIFIDSPAGTGFSYATTSQGYTNSDNKTAEYNYSFLRKWLLNHPEFVKNRLYIAGDSYGGKIAPMVALEIAKGGVYDNELVIINSSEGKNVDEELKQGYIVGNSRTDANKDNNEKVPYAHRMALISDEHFELANSSCHGEYVNPDPENIQCLYALRLVKENYNYVTSYFWANNETVQEALHIKKCTSRIYENHILEPKCKFMSPRPNISQPLQHFLEDDPVDLLSLSKEEQPWCRNYNYVTSYVWANDETVQEALHIRKAAGHTAPEYKPRQCFTMIKRWLSLYPL
ncbi:UNVERIFIED_CONTAM: Serine carboxypeptidase-like 18 [Sesamum radiatum]|uniref:Serine carboxypeptidase-like 18 n=1 Tax=Sesamum radiatum TaxID=300843 RepID=A0AAW2RXW0_SESRA